MALLIVNIYYVLESILCVYVHEFTWTSKVHNKMSILVFDFQKAQLRHREGY